MMDGVSFYPLFGKGGGGEGKKGRESGGKMILEGVWEREGRENGGEGRGGGGEKV